MAAIAITVPFLAGCQSGGPALGPGAAAPPASAELPSLPVPAGVRVVSPAPDVPKDLAAFSGTWGGYWDDVMPTLLIVEHVGASGDADGTYMWGAVPQWNVQAGHIRFHSKITGKKLSWGNNPTFEFTFSDDGKLHGERLVNGQENDVLMVKKPQ